MSEQDLNKLGSDYPTLEADNKSAPLSVWYAQNTDDIADFEKRAVKAAETHNQLLKELACLRFYEYT